MRPRNPRLVSAKADMLPVLLSAASRDDTTPIGLEPDPNFHSAPVRGLNVLPCLGGRALPLGENTEISQSICEPGVGARVGRGRGEAREAGDAFGREFAKRA